MVSAVRATPATVAARPASHTGPTFKATHTAAAITTSSTAAVASRRRIRGVRTSSFFGGSQCQTSWAATAPTSQAPAKTARTPSRPVSVSANTAATATGAAATSALRCSNQARALPQVNRRRASYSSI